MDTIKQMSLAFTNGTLNAKGKFMLDNLRDMQRTYLISLANLQREDYVSDDKLTAFDKKELEYLVNSVEKDIIDFMLVNIGGSFEHLLTKE
jgi:hypothetical protein